LATYTYDAAGRLTSAAVNSAGSTSTDTYAYTGNGLRASVTTDAGTSAASTLAMSWDTQTGSVPLLLSDSNNDYIYGPDDLPIEQVAIASGTVNYLHTDQYGSTRFITDSGGSCIATYRYTPTGQTANHTGAASTPLRWGGQYQDTATGLYYMRARYYDPVTYQFLAVDPLVDGTGQPYLYAGDDPLDGFDPLGLLTWNPLHWGKHTWETIGLVAGGVAIAATGVGAVIEIGGVSVSGAVGVGLTATAIGAGGVSTAVDGYGCLHGGGANSCAGAALGALSLGFGAGAVGLGIALAREENEIVADGLGGELFPELASGFLDAHALAVGLLAYIWDLLAQGDDGPCNP
jgi:RHS repeat-associated protein